MKITTGWRKTAVMETFDELIVLCVYLRNLNGVLVQLWNAVKYMYA